jgi:hypothetical protein
MQDSQKLCVSFKDYAGLNKKLCNNCITEPHCFIAVFIMQKDGSARLDFIQNIEYKFIELLSLDFANSPDDVVRRQIAYRYNSLKTKLSLQQDRINSINNLIKLKNPSLLLQIQKIMPNSKVLNMSQTKK